MFEELERINTRPEPFEFYTADDLWTDDHTSKQMLAYHLDGEIDLSSRNTDFIDTSADWIISHFKISPGTKIADFGCGPGLYTTRLAQGNAAVTGIDFSARSIDFAKDTAKRKGLSIHYIKQNYLKVEINDRFRLILMIMCDFCALSPDQRKRMLSTFHKLLEPGGAVLLDVYSLSAFENRKEATVYEANLLDGFWSPDKYYGFLNTFKYPAEKVILDKYTLYEAGRTRVVYNWLQYFSADALKNEFEACGFVVENLYSDVAGTPYSPGSEEFAVVARKPQRMPT